MSSYERATDARVRPGMNASAATKTNPSNLCHGVSYSCGKTCKSSRGLKVHQAKSKCQTPENKLKCFVSL